MNLDFKKTKHGKLDSDRHWKAETFEDRLRSKLGFTAKYESARLSIGRSLAEASAPDPVVRSNDEKGKVIAGEYLFGDDIDLWMSIFAIDGQLGVAAAPDDFRSLVEAHWSRGARLLQQDFEGCGEDDIRFVTRLAELLPSSVVGRKSTMARPGLTGEVKLKVWTVSRTYSSDQPIEFSINGQGAAPHIALMGKNGSGKTTTGVQIAIQDRESSKQESPSCLSTRKANSCLDLRPPGRCRTAFRISEASKSAISRSHLISCPILRSELQVSRKQRCSFATLSLCVAIIRVIFNGCDPKKG